MPRSSYRNSVIGVNTLATRSEADVRSEAGLCSEAGVSPEASARLEADVSPEAGARPETSVADAADTEAADASSTHAVAPGRQIAQYPDLAGTPIQSAPANLIAQPATADIVAALCFGALLLSVAAGR